MQVLKYKSIEATIERFQKLKNRSMEISIRKIRGPNKAKYASQDKQNMGVYVVVYKTKNNIIYQQLFGYLKWCIISDLQILHTFNQKSCNIYQTIY